MAKIKFTSALKNFFPDLEEMEMNAGSVKELLEEVNQKHPGIVGYLLDEKGQLRKHVNIFLDDELIKDRESLSDSTEFTNEVLIYQALSGG